MKNGIIFTHKGRTYIVIGECTDGVTEKKLCLCQELQRGLVVFPEELVNWSSSSERKTIQADTAATQQQEEALIESENTVAAGRDFPDRIRLQETSDNDIMNKSSDPGQNEYLMERFFDAGTASEKLDLLRQMKSMITEGMLSSMAISLDFELSSGDLDEKYYSLERYLRTRVHFEGRRPH